MVHKNHRYSKTFLDLPIVEIHKLKPGDSVAIVSPSSSAAGMFPEVFALGVKRLEDVFGLKVKIYPSTANISATLEDKARDLMDAFRDPENKGVIATIGGMIEKDLIPLLDENVFLENPKPFFGYSDNTHFHVLLSRLGIPSYYGGSVMTQYASPQSMSPYTVSYLHSALFTTELRVLESSPVFSEHDVDWGGADWNKPRSYETSPELLWDGVIDAEGILWGGCVESLLNIELPKNGLLKGHILILETSEEMPSLDDVEKLLRRFGSKGVFDEVCAVLVGIPKSWSFERPLSTEERVQFKNQQSDLLLRVIREYTTEIPIIQRLNFGHTDPQAVIPLGRMAYIDSSAKVIKLQY